MTIIENIKAKVLKEVTADTHPEIVKLKIKLAIEKYRCKTRDMLLAGYEKNFTMQQQADRNEKVIKFHQNYKW